MSNSLKISRISHTAVIIFLVILSVIYGSCNSRRTKLDTRNLIPEKDFISLLVDIHLADGLQSVPKINAWTSKLDTISAYVQVIKKHGYTKEMMDKTLNYYFVDDPKELNKIYDQVLGILSEMETRLAKESEVRIIRNTNLWPGKDFCSIPGRAVKDSTFFDIKLTDQGIYSLSYTVTAYPDDLSVNPKPFIYYCSADSVETGKKHYLKTIKYIKDGHPHNYYLSFNLGIKPVRLRGWLYNYDNRLSRSEEHIEFDDISFVLSLPR